MDTITTKRHSDTYTAVLHRGETIGYISHELGGYQAIEGTTDLFDSIDQAAHYIAGYRLQRELIALKADQNPSQWTRERIGLLQADLDARAARDKNLAAQLCWECLGDYIRSEYGTKTIPQYHRECMDGCEECMARNEIGHEFD